MKIVFMGTPEAAVPSLERCLSDGHEVVAIYTQPDRPSGRGNKITFSPVKELGRVSGIPVYQPTKIKTPEAISFFRSHCADLAIVVAFGRILPSTFLTAFPKGAINVHFSLLPKYRGAAPVNWAIVNGETESGVTTMLMDAGLDTGAMLLQRSTIVGTAETAVDLMSRLSLLGAELLSETLSRFGEVYPIDQDHLVATHAPIMKRDDGVIDWQMSANEISNRIRGFQPFPSSFTPFRQIKLTLWQGYPSSEYVGRNGIAGEILESHGDRFYVRCGDGSVLKIDEVQTEGKRRMAIRDFINGFRPQEGEVLGV